MTEPAWRRVQSIDEVLPLLREMIKSNKSADAAGGGHGRQYSTGCSEKALAAAEKELGGPIPSDLRAFYSKCGGVSGTADNRFDDSVYGIDDVSWDHPYWFPRLEDYIEDGFIDSAWADAGFLFFGGDGCGSSIAYCEFPPERPAGSIVLLAHDPDEIQFLADSFPQWLARFVACGGRDYSLYPLSLFELDEALEADFVRDHLRLNPKSDWALERLARIELEASGAEDRFHWWDNDARRLRPFAELGDKEHVDQSQARSRSLESLTRADAGAKLKHLDLSFSRVQDIKGVEALQSLEILYLNATPVSNIEPVAQLAALKRLDVSDTAISDLSPLQDLHKLWYLDLDRTRVADLTPLKHLNRLKSLDLQGAAVSDISPLLGLKRLENLTFDAGVLTGADIKALKKINKKISVRVVGADGYVKDA